MKTYYLINSKKNAFSLIGLVAIFTASCGSYQNSSYYDNDGVYGSTERPKEQVENKYSEQNIEKSNEYAQQFKAMQEDYAYFTDVDTYQSEEPQDTAVVVYRNEYSDQEYAGWGNNASNVTINYYDNNWGWNNWYSPYWGYSNIGWGAGWGWNSWYGPSWGWGWNSYYGPSWGMGWNGYYGSGWGGGYYNSWDWYGYRGRNVAYNAGPRGGSGYYNSGSGRNSANYTNGGRRTNPNFNGTPRTTNPRGTFQSPRSSQNGGAPRTTTSPRTNSPRTTTPATNAPRENSTVTPRSNNNYSSPRTNNNSSTPRNNSNYSTPRSSSSGGFGGSSSGGGGGRSSGGGGGRGGRG